MADIDFGQLSEALNDKSDRDLRNVDTTAKADAVIDYQEPTSANNYTWYRKYKSGWVEQGGVAPIRATSVTFPIEMLDVNYYFNSSLTDGGNAGTIHTISGSYTTTGCSLLEGQYNYPGSALTNTAKWYVCGKAAN